MVLKNQNLKCSGNDDVLGCYVIGYGVLVNFERK